MNVFLLLVFWFSIFILFYFICLVYILILFEQKFICRISLIRYNGLPISEKRVAVLFSRNFNHILDSLYSFCCYFISLIPLSTPFFFVSLFGVKWYLKITRMPILKCFDRIQIQKQFFNETFSISSTFSRTKSQFPWIENWSTLQIRKD